MYSKKQMVDRNMIKHFRQIQESELQTWKGLNAKFTLRPGMGEAANQGAGIGGSSMAVGSLQAAGNSSNSQFSSFAPSSGGGQILNSINNIGASGASGGLSSNGQAAKKSLPGQADFFEDQR